MTTEQEKLLAALAAMFEAKTEAADATIVQSIFASARAEKEAEQERERIYATFVALVEEQIPKDAEYLNECLQPYFYCGVIKSRFIGCKSMLRVCKSGSETEVCEIYYSLQNGLPPYYEMRASSRCANHFFERTAADVMRNKNFQYILKQYIL